MFVQEREALPYSTVIKVRIHCSITNNENTIFNKRLNAHQTVPPQLDWPSGHRPG